MATKRQSAPLPRLDDGATSEGLNDEPKHLIISNAIKRQIAIGELPAGVQLPTEARLTRHFGVSRITVRRAIQDLTRDGVLIGQQGRGTFVNASKAALEANILFVHASDSEITYPYTALILEGLRHYGTVTTRGMRIQLTGMPDITHQSPGDTTIEELVEFGRCHGVVTFPRIHPAAMQRLVDKEVPIIMIGGQHYLTPPEGVAIVGTDQSSILSLALEHLHSTGKRQIGLLRAENKGGFINRERVEEIGERLGISMPPSHFEVAAEWGINAGERAMERLLERCPYIDAVFAADDLFAVGALHALWKRGIRVPEDIAVLGVGNQLGEHSHSGLSTIDIRLHEHGEIAGRCLQRHFKGLPVERLTLITPLLLRRATT